MKNKIDSILFSIVYKSHQIVYRHDDGYYLVNFADYIKIHPEHISELLELGYVEKNKYGGLFVTEAAVAYSETICVKKRKESEIHPGKFRDYFEVPSENYNGEL